MRVDDVELLRCPESKSSLTWQGTNLEGVLQDGVLVSPETGTAWSMVEGWARLTRQLELDEDRSRLLQWQDQAPRLHDPFVRFVLPRLGATPEGRFRGMAVDHLALDALAGQSGVRILEVGTGTGAGLETVSRRLPPGVDASLWGTDVSLGLLSEARRRAERARDPNLQASRLLLAHGFQLPFQDNLFDRVFHLGGLAPLLEPRGTLEEMCRVARPGAPVVVIAASPASGPAAGFLGQICEGLVPSVDASVLQAAVPDQAVEPAVQRLDRLFVSLVFRAP